MSLSFNRYIDITSSVAANQQVNGRDLGGRLFTNNPLLPTGSVIEFNTATEVGAYFGYSSAEALRAQDYFSFISKNTTSPQQISFSRWVDVDVAPMIFGAVQTQTLAIYTAISNGSFSITIGGVNHVVTGLDLTAGTSLTDVANKIQSALHTFTGTQWTASVVSYNASRGSFNFVGGDAVAATITVANAVSGTNLAPLLGWLTGGIFSSGSLAETITETLQNSLSQSNNFGSFLFIPTLTLDQITEAAAWTDSLDVVVMYFSTVSIANGPSYRTALATYGGVGVTVSANAGEYPEQLPMTVFASTDYNAANSTQNYMFQQDSNLTPSVTDDTTANTLDQNFINYYGQTQQSGQQISFYQRGVLMGIDTSPTDMNVYANEIWLKDACGVAIMNLLLALPKISANIKGSSQILSALQSVIDQAVRNGTISVGKALNNTQKLYITEISGNPNAWQQVQNIGYWVNCAIVPDDEGGFKAEYSLIYSKDDDIRFVSGKDILI